MISSIRNCVYREKMFSGTVNLVAFFNFMIFVTHKTKQEKIKRTKTHLGETMAEKKEQ